MLNLLLQAAGYAVVLQPTDHLRHIGGVSLWATPVLRKHGLPPPTVRLWTRLQRHIRRFVRLPKVNQNAFQQRPALDPAGIARKQAVSRYFGELLHALVDQQPLPPLLHVQEPAVDQRIFDVTKLVIRLWE